MHFELSKKENRCIERRLERFKQLARQLVGKGGTISYPVLFDAAIVDGEKSFPGALPCGMTVVKAIRDIRHTCQEETRADDKLTLETCAFYLELASGRISGLSRSMDPDEAAICYTASERLEDADEEGWLYPPQEAKKAAARSSRDGTPDWLSRKKFLPEELAELCGKDPVTVRIWRSKGRGGVKLTPDKDSDSDSRSSSRLMFTPEAVNDFLKVNDDLRTKELDGALDAIKKAAVNAPKPDFPLSALQDRPNSADIQKKLMGDVPDFSHVELASGFTDRSKSSELYQQYLQARLEENLREREILIAELSKFKGLS